MSACATVVMVNLGFDLSKQRLPEQKRATSDAVGEAWSRAPSTAVNHACYLWLGGDWIAAASCSRAGYDYFLQPLKIAASAMGPASNPAHKR